MTMVEMKWGGVQHGLHHPLESAEPKLVDGQGQDDGNREAPQQAVQAQQNGVANHTHTVGAAEESLEPVKPHPFAAQIALAGLKVTEGDLDAVHGDVLVNDGDDHRDQQQQVKLPVGGQPGFQGHLVDSLHRPGLRLF
ncbi:MAG: hypothetical protein LUG55_06445 [Clostridiales bacterium]|nr:hypothetical protein [Clostridiales bacterium]